MQKTNIIYYSIRNLVSNWSQYIHLLFCISSYRNWAQLISTLSLTASEVLNTQWGPVVRQLGPQICHPAMLSSWRVCPCWLGTDKMWSTREGNGKPLQYSCLEKPMNSMRRQKDMTLKDESPRSGGVQYTTGVEWRYSYRKNEEAETKWKQCPVVVISCGESKVQSYKNNTA